MKRLFFALWPNNEIRKQIGKIGQSINSKGLKAIRCDNLHVTLVFLGNVDATSEALIRQRMKHVSVDAFSLNFDQMDFWRKPRLLCLTTQQYDQQLLILVNALKSELEKCGIKIEGRPYKPHITLARKARRLIDIDVPMIEWQAQSFCLVESLNTLDGIHYQVLEHWKFK